MGAISRPIERIPTALNSEQEGHGSFRAVLQSVVDPKPTSLVAKGGQIWAT